MRILLTFVLTLLLAGCAKTTTSQLASRAVEEYCPYLPSKTFASAVSVSGSAVYEYRQNGNGVASDGGEVLSVDNYVTSATRTYSVTVNGTTYSAQSSLSSSAGKQDVVAKLKEAINTDSASGLYAYGYSSLTIAQPDATASPTVTAPTRLSSASTNPTARPVRFAEIAVKDSSGTIVQCAETLSDGTYSFELPANTGTYTVSLRSRSNNTSSAVYVLDNPTANTQHSISKTVDTSGAVTGLLLRARVHEGLMGGAFNILDQLLNAQNYLRTETANCDQPADSKYFAGCVPVESVPLVRVYWSPGVSPGAYVGTSGAISFYLNGRRELYLQGGQNGNVTSSDMDHFDNSVILHEYGHFLEDVYGKSDSPGGSHNADSIVDPRLAWSEGWANFFQAAVTGVASYRDTYGTPDCTSTCAGTYFNESVDPPGVPGNDAPTPGAVGEGNFREFSVTRMLWDVIKPVGGVSRFAEIWRAFVASNGGMKVVDDPFKSVGRFHQIQTSSAGGVAWTSLRTAEEQAVGFSFYATPFLLGQTTCATSPIAMTPNKGGGDNGAFATSDQFRNNDFYRLDHAGGSFTLELFYSKDSTNPPDLDLYLYKSRYVYGRSADMHLSSGFTGDGCPAGGTLSDSLNPFRAQNGCPGAPAGLSSSYGYEKSTTALGPGTYMINVRADTTIRAGAATSYVLLLNGQAVCPQP